VPLACEKEEKGLMLTLTLESLAKEVVGQISSAEIPIINNIIQ
jgi:hypothetical protein